MDLIITILPMVTKDLPISPRSSTLTTRQPIVEFYLLTFPRFPLRKKEQKSSFGKNRTHDFRTSRCGGYLIDYSGEELVASSDTTVCIQFESGLHICLFPYRILENDVLQPLCQRTHV